MIKFKNPMVSIIEYQIEEHWEYQLENLCDDLEDYDTDSFCSCCKQRVESGDEEAIEAIECEIQDCLVMLGYWYEQLEIAKGE